MKMTLELPRFGLRVEIDDADFREEVGLVESHRKKRRMVLEQVQKWIALGDYDEAGLTGLPLVWRKNADSRMNGEEV